MSDSTLSEFLRVSSELGGNPALVQGAGGNTSLKRGDVILVKASGTKLADSLKAEIFVELDLGQAREAVNNQRFDRLTTLASTSVGVSALRPSIETALHVIMPHKCVAHVHALNTIAVSVQPALAKKLDAALKGLRWARIPYVMPGEPLARAVLDKVERSEIDILILDNHGLVVGAESPESVIARLQDVEARLAPLASPRTRPNVTAAASLIDECSNTDRFHVVERPEIQALAFEPRARATVLAGTLYPDHVVFLGPATALRLPGESLAECADRFQAQRGARARLIVTPDAGVVFDGPANETEHEMASCLADLAFRISGEDLTVLSNEDELKLVNWDAEIYRRQLNSK